MATRKITVLNTQGIYDHIHKYMSYNPDTGSMTWKKSTGGGQTLGAEVGHTNSKGYRGCKVCGRSYKLHRLIWLYQTGSFPKHDIDHINRNRSDNRWSNLRDVKSDVNAYNHKVRKDSKTGISGVSVTCDKYKLPYHVRIAVDNEEKHLGFYKTLDEAAMVRYNAECKYGLHEAMEYSSAHQYLKEHNLL